MVVIRTSLPSYLLGALIFVCAACPAQALHDTRIPTGSLMKAIGYGPDKPYQYGDEIGNDYYEVVIESKQTSEYKGKKSTKSASVARSSDTRETFELGPTKLTFKLVNTRTGLVPGIIGLPREKEIHLSAIRDFIGRIEYESGWRHRYSLHPELNQTYAKKVLEGVEHLRFFYEHGRELGVLYRVLLSLRSYSHVNYDFKDFRDSHRKTAATLYPGLDNITATASKMNLRGGSYEKVNKGTTIYHPGDPANPSYEKHDFQRTVTASVAQVEITQNAARPHRFYYYPREVHLVVWKPEPSDWQRLQGILANIEQWERAEKALFPKNPELSRLIRNMFDVAWTLTGRPAPNKVSLPALPPGGLAFLVKPAGLDNGNLEKDWHSGPGHELNQSLGGITNGKPYAASINQDRDLKKVEWRATLDIPGKFGDEQAMVKYQWNAIGLSPRGSVNVQRRDMRFRSRKKKHYAPYDDNDLLYLKLDKSSTTIKYSTRYTESFQNKRTDKIDGEVVEDETATTRFDTSISLLEKGSINVPGSVEKEAGLILALVRQSGTSFEPLKGALGYGQHFFIEGRLEDNKEPGSRIVTITAPGAEPMDVELKPLEDDPTVSRSEMLYLIWPETNERGVTP